MEIVASLSLGRTAAAQCGLFTHKSVLVIFEPACIFLVSQFFKSKDSLYSEKSNCGCICSWKFTSVLQFILLVINFSTIFGACV